MKNVLLALGVNLVSLACVGGAIYLNLTGKEGWGWFLFAALLCFSTPAFSKKP